MSNNKPVIRELPTITELTTDLETAVKNDKLNLLLNQEPPKQWVRDHPIAMRQVKHGNITKKEPVKYIPISMIEMALTMIFQVWEIEVIEYKQLFNSVTCHIRLHYVHPITREDKYQDGLGAVAVQTDSGKSAADLSAIKHDAVMKALPASKSFAIKDAADHLGKIFGRDLNRDETVGFFSKFDEGPQKDIGEILNGDILNDGKNEG